MAGKDATKKRGRGRPSKYSPEIVADLCAGIAKGKSLNSLCAPSDKPDIATVFRWLDKYPEFRDKYAQAKEASADYMADELLEIADASTGDVQRDRLRVDTRKWIAAKLKPKKYGERQQVEHSGEVKTGLSKEQVTAVLIAAGLDAEMIWQRLG
jgi:hypothetical protein